VDAVAQVLGELAENVAADGLAGLVGAQGCGGARRFLGLGQARGEQGGGQRKHSDGGLEHGSSASGVDGSGASPGAPGARRAGSETVTQTDGEGAAVERGAEVVRAGVLVIALVELVGEVGGVEG